MRHLSVVTDGKNHGAATGEQFEPGVLQLVGILHLVDQDVTETIQIVLAQRFVALQQFIAAQE